MKCWVALEDECHCICLGINHGRLIKQKLKEMGDQDYWTIQAMLKYGGSFVQMLAKLAQLADRHNLLKVKLTWKEYWSEYEQLGGKLKAEQMDKHDYAGNE